MDDPIVAEPVINMTRHQKLATLLVILGPDSAAQLLEGLDGYELELVSMEMAKVTLISQELRAAILQEFSELPGGNSEGGGRSAAALVEFVGGEHDLPLRTALQDGIVLRVAL